MLNCKICNVKCSTKQRYDTHLLTARHQKWMIFQGFKQEKQEIVKSDISQGFRCDPCGFFCEYESIWSRHIQTYKHKTNVLCVMDGSGNNFTHRYKCKFCNEPFEVYNKYWYHQKKCETQKFKGLENITSLGDIDPKLLNDIIVENKELRNFVLNQAKELQKQNLELQNKVIETTQLALSNTTTTNTHNITNNLNGNINNNRFNINVFLNEQCKNAMNLSDFINSIEVSREDLENNAQLGFVKGITKIIIDNLKNIDLDTRPFHCCDFKRQTMYIRDGNKWEKDTDNVKMTGLIKEVSMKSMRTLSNWKNENPEYKEDNSEFRDMCVVISNNSIAGMNRDTYYPKIIQTLAKETIIDKHL
jgi:hypothetical protein